MAAYHTVEQGECLNTIARKYRFTDYLAIYNHPGNAVLKRRRPNPNILFPGDKLFIPDKEQKQVDRGTSHQHSFQVSSPTCLLRVRVHDEEEKPYANKCYVLKIEETTYRGCTSSQGLVEQKIPVDAAKAKLMLWPDEDDQNSILRIDLALGCLDPIDQVSGVQARLNNLGFPCGAVDGIAGAKTEAALKRFQRKAGLEPTGNIDSQTCSRLAQWHDSMAASAA